MSSVHQFQRDFENSQLNDKTSGNWLRRLAVNRQDVHSFEAMINGRGLAFLATIEILDDSVVPEPVRWHVQPIRCAQAGKAPVSDAERAAVSALLIGFETNLNPYDRHVEVAHTP